MKKHILIFFMTLSTFLMSQDINIISEIPKSIKVENIINNYIKKIGGEKKINKIQTIKKEFKTNMEGLENMTMTGEVLYKVPDLYSSILEIEKVGQIQSTKYDGKNCIIKRQHNTKSIERKLEGKLLEDKMDEFNPFPILKYWQQNATFVITEIHKSKKSTLYKVIVNKSPTNEICLFFDKKSYLIVKKIIQNGKTIKITEYQNYKEIEGIMFPFLEIVTTEIDSSPAQKSINTITSIIINEEITIDRFQ